MFDNYFIEKGFDTWHKPALYVVTLLTIWLIYFLGKKKVKFSYRVLLSMFIGIVVGLTLGQATTYITGFDESITITYLVRPIGQLYLRSIQMVIMPLVLTAIIKSFTSLDDTSKLKSISFKTLFYLLATTAIASVIGILFAYIPNLGSNFVPDDLNYTPRPIEPIENVILNFFPSNITQALSGNVAIPVVTFALFVSVAIIVESKRHPERMKPFLDFNESFNHIMTRITKFVMKLTPYAVFSFMAYAVGRNNVETLKQLGIYILLIHGAMIVHFVFVQMGLLAVNRISPKKFLENFYPTMTVAFTTQSSYGTMPVNIKTLEERVGVSSKIANFVAPIGANVGMNACGGIFPAMVAILTANAYGIEFTFVSAILIVVITTIASIGIAGVPGIATIAATVTLASLGLPIEGIALIVAVDPLVDMTRTLINVTGVGVTATVVAKKENELDFDTFNASNRAEQII